MPDGSIVANTDAWMEHLPAATRRRPVRELVIPGSHDAGTWTIGPIGKEAARTQSGPVGAQLAAGSRYLDLRAKEALLGDDFFMAHGIIVSDYPLMRAIDELHAFAASHPGEVVFATLSLEGTHAEQARRAVASKLAGVLVPLDGFHSGMSLDDIAATGRNVVLTGWDGGTFLDRSGIYSETAYAPAEIEAFYVARFARMPRDRMWIWHPNPPYYFGGPSLETNARNNHAWFAPRFADGTFADQRPNIVSLDFINEFGWVEPVIGMNAS